MTVREAPRVPHSRGDVVEELPVWRLNLMRVGYS
jgi:hypothetical protein